MTATAMDAWMAEWGVLVGSGIVLLFVGGMIAFAEVAGRWFNRRQEDLTNQIAAREKQEVKDAVEAAKKKAADYAVSFTNSSFLNEGSIMQLRGNEPWRPSDALQPNPQATRPPQVSIQ